VTGPDADALPILAELEEAFGRMVRAELRGDATAGSAAPGARPRVDAVPPGGTTPRVGAPPPAVPPADRGRRRRERAPLAARLPFPTGRRILGRALAAGALAGVVGATALATKSVVVHGGAEAPRTLQRAGDHEVVLRHHRGRWCLDVTYAGGVASRCFATPGGSGLAPLSAVVPGGRAVVGLAGPDVARVTVRRSGRSAVVATHAVAGAPRLRWFAAELGPVAHEARHAAVVVPAPAGRTVADCTLGTAASCRAAREHSRVRM
jgi:hypothetical protein